MGNLARDAWKAALLGNYNRAGILYRSAGELEKAVQMFVKDGDLRSAAEVEIELGRILDASKHMVAAGDKVAAADLLKNHKQYIKAARLYAEAGNLTVAADLARKAGNPLLAGEFEERAERFFYAALDFRAASKMDRAVKAMERAIPQFPAMGAANPFDMDEWQQRREMAARLLEEGKAYARAADVYEALGFAEQAAAACERGGLLSRAMELYRQAGAMDKVADLAERCTDAPVALRAEALASRGEGIRAAALYAQAGSFTKAAQLLQDGGDFAGAGRMWREAAEWERAGNTLFKAGVFAEAADCFRRGQLSQMAMEAYEKAGDLSQALKMAFDAGAWDRAYTFAQTQEDRDSLVALWQGVPSASSQYPMARIMLSRAFLDMDRPKLAKECLSGLPPGVVGDAPWVEYMGARVAEALGERETALDLYQKVLSRDLKFTDAQLRLHRLELEASQAPKAKIEKRVGPYVVLKKVGSGGMADVYFGKDSRDGREVALKIPHPQYSGDAQYKKRFLLEGQIGCTLHHPGVVAILDMGEAAGRLYIAMEFVDGVTLKEVLRRRTSPFPANEATRITLEIAGVLRYTHGAGVIHRDLKPDNIMVLNAGGGLKVTDFGVAKRMDATSFTVDGQILGTPNYLPPEPFLGLPYDCRSDLYSLGAIYYEMLTLRRPFEAPTLPETLRKHQAPDRPRPSEVNPKLPPALDQVVLKLLSVRPEARYPNVDALIPVLETVISFLQTAQDTRPFEKLNPGTAPGD
jgi:tetratricopeptide (TPR) repeat protein